MKNCPFCASENVHIEKRFVVSIYHAQARTETSIVCGNCGAAGPNKTNEREAEKSWNMRHTKSNVSHPVHLDGK